jgi:hypothetical protein
MIKRDWNHPSIILWGVRINESQDNHPFYVRTNKLAHELDPSRPTGGIRYLYDSDFLEDVFTMNDFEWPLKPPNHPLYLNTEFAGHTYSTKRFDQVERVAEHMIRHARVHNQLGTNDQYAGGIGWCAFDYNTATSVQAIISAITACSIFSASRKPPRDFINRSATQRRKLFLSLRSTGHRAIIPAPAGPASFLSARIATT